MKTEIDFTRRKIFGTDDGSSSLKLQDVDEQYHSVHGAVQESLHIYIENGLHHWTGGPDIAVLECGFGTGLNAALTFMHAQKRNIAYDTVEAYPLSSQEVQQLNYPSVIEGFPEMEFHRMHEAKNGEKQLLSPSFAFRKFISGLENMSFSDCLYDVVYFDMFNPDIQPELWTEDIFLKIYRAMKPGGILLTYCAKGSVKRALKASGFAIESIPGPPGKREITRGLRG